MPSEVPRTMVWDRVPTEVALVKSILSHQTVPELEAIVERVSRGLGSKVALLTVLDEDEQTFVASRGLGGNLGSMHKTPVEWAFCRRVCTTRSTVVVPDALSDPEYADSALVRAKVVRSYAGAPVQVDGVVVGALCVLGADVRQYSDAEVALLEVAAIGAGRVLKETVEASASVSSSSSSTPPSGRAKVDRAIPAPDGLVDGRWQLLHRVAGGGQGEVWQAREVASGREVAVKVSRKASGAVLAEAKALSRVRHPHVVSVHAAGHLDDGREFYVMEYVEGEPMMQALRARGTLDLEMLVDRITRVAGAVTAVHGAGYIHGDLKPSNILEDRVRDGVVLIDLGLDIRLGEPMSQRGGTVGLSAPEQFDGSRPPITRAADVYGLAACTWQLLAGVAPFAHHRQNGQMLEAQNRADLLPLPRFPAIEALLRRALDPDPLRRPATPLAFAYGLAHAAQAANGVEPEVMEGVSSVAVATMFDMFRESMRGSPEMDHIRGFLESGAPFLSQSDWAQFLADASGDDTSVVLSKARRAARERGRARISTSRLVFELNTVCEALGGIFGHFLPYLRFRLEHVGADGAMARLHIPEPNVAVQQAYVSGVVTELLAHCGASVVATFHPDGEEHWRLLVRWTRY